MKKLLSILLLVSLFGCASLPAIINPQTMNVAAMTMQAIQLGYVALCSKLQMQPSAEVLLVVQKVDASLDQLGKLLANQQVADTTVDKVLAGAEDALNLMRIILNK